MAWLQLVWAGAAWRLIIRPQTSSVSWDDLRASHSGTNQACPSQHSWYAYRCHEDCSSWWYGLAMLTLESPIASLPLPFLVWILERLRSLPLLGKEATKKHSPTHTDAGTVQLRLQ